MLKSCNRKRTDDARIKYLNSYYYFIKKKSKYKIYYKHSLQNFLKYQILHSSLSTMFNLQSRNFSGISSSLSYNFLIVF